MAEAEEKLQASSTKFQWNLSFDSAQDEVYALRYKPLYFNIISLCE